MSVHLQIAKQINSHIKGQKEFKALDERREALIDEAIAKAKSNSEFSVNEINQVTAEMNQIGQKFNFPLRKQVTREMVLQYIAKSQQ